MEMWRLLDDHGSLYFSRPIWRAPFVTRESDKNHFSSLLFAHRARYSGDSRFSTDMGDAPHLVGAGYL